MVIENVKKFISINWKLLLLFGLFAFYAIKGCVEDAKIDNYGVTTTVVVQSYERIAYHRNDYRRVSVGYYVVNNNRYKCFTWKELPMGSIFQVKYNPDDPTEWRHLIDR